MGKIKDLKGMRFFKLLVVKEDAIKKNKMYWICKCDCGNEKSICAGSLVSNLTKSCGCYNKEMASKRQQTHGMYKSPEYSVWCGMKSRCSDVNDSQYKNYGGRGIKVCDKWRNSFETFFLDMGKRPSKEYSIDRIDNDGNYEPSNCRWATKEQQSRNTSKNHWIEYNGTRMILADWAKYFGIHHTSIIQHFSFGKDFDYIYNYYKGSK